jgi:protoporphyrinogen oxidase
VIENMMSRRHSGFNVYCGQTIRPRDEQAMENLARYIIRASFSQERMTYVAARDCLDGAAKVIYTSKDGKRRQTFEAINRPAQLVAHIPNRGEQLVGYYGYYSNRSRGDRKKKGTDDQAPALMDPEVSSKHLRRSWARLIQKIYNVDPFTLSL